LAQIGYSNAQTLRQHVEDLTQLVQVGLLAEALDEAGDVPVVGDVRDRSQAEQSVQGRIATQLGQARSEGGMTQGDGEDDGAPQHRDGEVVAALAAGTLQTLQQRLVGQDLQQPPQGGELRVVLQAGPSEQRIRGVQSHPCLQRMLPLL
jgi:hypothetical protein